MLLYTYDFLDSFYKLLEDISILFIWFLFKKYVATITPQYAQRILNEIEKKLLNKDFTGKSVCIRVSEFFP